MPSPSHVTWQQSLLSWVEQHADLPDLPAMLDEQAEAIEALWELDLEPARGLLLQGYAANPRGSKPRDPVVMLRALLLAVLVGVSSINKWVPRLRASELLRVLAGFDDTGAPGVGTFYDFLHRLHDGSLRHRRDVVLPSEQERARALLARNLKEEREAARERKKGKEPKSTRQTTLLVNALREAAEQKCPADMLHRLAAILAEVAVRPSFERGLLGSPGEIVVGGDGTPLPTGASRVGRKPADDGGERRLRIYADPDAQWGWDSHRDRFYFGHHAYEFCALGAGHDLPIFLRLDPANRSEKLASLEAFDQMRKLYAERIPELHLDYLVQDAGHDSEWHWRYPMSFGVTPVIPLATASPAEHPVRRAVQLSPKGLPLCPGMAEMTPWGAFDGRRMFVCPKKAGSIEVCPRAPDEDPDWCCRPEAKFAPSLSLSIEQNPRLTPPIPRDTRRWKKLYALRSGCERSNAVKKETFGLEQAKHRRHSFWLIRMVLMAILQHAKAWRAQLGKGSVVAELLAGVARRAA
jgi:hypothetical protein